MADNTPASNYAAIGSAFLGKVAQRLQNLKPEELSAADVARWTDVALKLEQAGHRSTYNRADRLSRMQITDLADEDAGIDVDNDAAMEQTG